MFNGHKRDLLSFIESLREQATYYAALIVGYIDVGQWKVIYQADEMRDLLHIVDELQEEVAYYTALIFGYSFI